jgi:hypothetical protein
VSDKDDQLYRVFDPWLLRYCEAKGIGIVEERSQGDRPDSGGERRSDEVDSVMKALIELIQMPLEPRRSARRS